MLQGLKIWRGKLYVGTVWTLLHNQKNQTKIAANLAIYAANCISIDHFLCLIIISSHSILIKSEKLEFFSKIHKKSSTNKNLSYEYFDSILLITKKPGQI